jgi:NAD(P)H-quinone oxidoreductase subunit 5
MLTLVFSVAVLPLLGLLSFLLLPSRKADEHRRHIRKAVTILTGLNAVAALAALTSVAASGGDISLQIINGSPVILLLDGVSAIMWALVASVGWVTCRYSVRYLDGEPNQGSYFRWSAFTIGSVTLFVLSGHLVLSLASLLMTSVGLHQLLLHYRDRPAAGRAADVKFVFSRLGDACLLVAAVMLFREFGTLTLTDLFAAIRGIADSGSPMPSSLATAGWLIAGCAVFKSAQFPFHTWLPETMEAPTPVSALMHAGIVNAGGYLLIRMAPVMAESGVALLAVAGLGGFTAVFAALAMLSQTSVKRSLAYSTIAQMGFMMLQCGLGAMSAAMLHIIVHSLYKAHAFLASGSVLQTQAATTAPMAPARSTSFRFATLLASVAIVTCSFMLLAALFGVSPATKPGGTLLGFLLCLGLSRWIWQLFQTGNGMAQSGVVLSLLLIGVYLAAFTAVDSLLMAGSGQVAVNVSAFAVMGLIAAAFACLFAVELLIGHSLRSRLLQSLYVHSSNGFYVDTAWRYVARSLTS